MNGGGIDYSKWDHLDDSGSSEEELPYPRVTRLEAPSRVSTKDGTISVQQTSTPKRKSGGGSTSSTTTRAPVKTKQKSLEEYIQEWTLHGGTCSNLYWSQDRETVVLRMNISPNVKGSNIHVTLEGAIPYTNRHCATATEPCTLSITSNNDTVILEGKLPHAVYVEKDNEVDWMLELVREEKYLVLTLYKATPTPNMTIWWKRPLTQFDEMAIDVVTSQTQFQEAWAEAHEQFQKNIAAGKLSTQSDGQG